MGRMLLEGFAKGVARVAQGGGKSVSGNGSVVVGVGGGGICCQTENGDTPLHLAVSNWRNRLDDGCGAAGAEGETKLDKNTIRILELLMGNGDGDGAAPGGADDAGGGANAGGANMPERDAAGFPLSTIGYDAFGNGNGGGGGLDGMSSGGHSFDMGLDSRNCPILITNREKVCLFLVVVAVLVVMDYVFCIGLVVQGEDPFVWLVFKLCTASFI